ncbi:WXG100 family type VII secretion target [Streptomyces sp. NPDC096068]|uniref:WXG100 family type VII secretion target n=1 Tax=Streptomyces sp. NPDC096068 TaxID=3155424 RepID=UPI003322029C
MTDGTSVSVEGMIRASNTFEGARDTAIRSYSRMHEQIGVLAASWSGDAAKVYGSAMENWLANFRSVITALENMQSSLDQNASSYAQTHSITQEEADALAAELAETPALQGLPGF